MVNKSIILYINAIRSPVRENMFSLFNSDIVNLLLNINRGRKKKICYFCSLVYFICW